MKLSFVDFRISIVFDQQVDDTTAFCTKPLEEDSIERAALYSETV